MTLVVVLVSKFVEGAWVMICWSRRCWPCSTACGATTATSPASGHRPNRSTPTNLKPPLVLLPIRGWSAITRKALRFALKISPDVYALHIADDETDDGGARRQLGAAASGSRPEAADLPAPKLIVIYSPFRRLYRAADARSSRICSTPTPTATSP